MQTALTLADLLSDLRYVAAGYAFPVSGSRELHVGQVDSDDALIELAWTERRGCRVVPTLAGCDVLHATRDVALDEAA